MNNRHYNVIIEWDAVEQLWVTYVPALNYLSTYGETREEALAQTQEAMLGYLEAAAKEGIPVPAGDSLTESWRLIFDDKYKGRLAWRDDAHGMIMTAALALGHKDPAKLAGNDLREVGKFLIDRKKNIRTMWTKFGEAVGLMASGEVWAMYGWVSMRAALRKQGHKVLNNWPRESLLTWSFCALVPKDAPRAEAAMRVINVMLSADYGSKLVDTTNYPSTSATAAAQFTKEQWAERGLDIDQHGIPLYGFDLPPAMDQWVETWNTVRAAT